MAKNQWQVSGESKTKILRFWPPPTSPRLTGTGSGKKVIFWWYNWHSDELLNRVEGLKSKSSIGRINISRPAFPATAPAIRRRRLLLIYHECAYTVHGKSADLVLPIVSIDFFMTKSEANRLSAVGRVGNVHIGVFVGRAEYVGPTEFECRYNRTGGFSGVGTANSRPWVAAHQRPEGCERVRPKAKVLPAPFVARIRQN